MAADCGDVVGKAVKIEIPPSGLSVAGSTNAIPGVCGDLLDDRRARAARAASVGVSTTTTSGPLTPGPKPSASQS